MNGKTKDRHGVALVLVVLLIGAFLAVAAASINIAYMQLVRTEMRAAADAAARAGSETLARLDSKEAAIQQAIAVAALNKVGGSPLVLVPEDISVGHAQQKGNSHKWEFLDNQTPYSSVRVAKETTSQLFFTNVHGRESFSPSVVSTAAFSENEICLVIDRSHSMCFDHSGTDWQYPPGTPTAPPDPVVHPPQSGSRWESLESAVSTFLTAVQTINATQRVCLVTWGSEITASHYEGALTGRTFPASIVDVPLTTNMSSVASVITNRGNDVMLGGTNLSAGMEDAMAVLTGPDSHDFASKIMVVMTDGKWNMGTDPNQVAKDAKKAGITIHTVTFLDDADQTDMKKVAKTAGGTHYHASNSAELETVFREIASSLPVVLID